MSTEKNETPKPSPDLQGKFEVVGVVPGVIVTKKYGDVDLRTISAEMAEKLVKDGFQYLKKVESKPTKELPEAKK